MPRPLLAVLILLFALSAVPAMGGVVWDELGIPAGGRIMLAGGLSPGQALIGFSFPAGTSTLPEAALIPLLAPRVWIGAGGLDGLDGDLRRDLGRLGWSLETSCDLDGAGLILSGPAAGLDRVTTYLLRRLETTGFEPADLELAWEEQERAWQAAGESPEMTLRDGMAKLHHGEDPYSVGVGIRRIRPENAMPPTPESMSAFLDERYQAGGMLMLVAGDFEPKAFLGRWQRRLEALPGKLVPSPPISGTTDLGGGDLRIAAGDRNLLILQYPGPRGADLNAAATAALAGVLTLRMMDDIRGSGLARSASAWFDFTSPGKRPLEIQVRDFDMERLDALRSQLERVFERMREGDFSEYTVITAKDNLFQAMDAASVGAEGPREKSVESLIRWSRNLLRQSLHFRRWRAPFERRLLDTGKPEIQAAATRLLVDERVTLGLLDADGER